MKTRSREADTRLAFLYKRRNNGAFIILMRLKIGKLNFNSEGDFSKGLTFLNFFSSVIL